MCIKWTKNRWDSHKSLWILSSSLITVKVHKTAVLAGEKSLLEEGSIFSLTFFTCQGSWVHSQILSIGYWMNGQKLWPHGVYGGVGVDFNESHICIITNGARVFEEGSRRGYKRRDSPVEVGVLSKGWVGRGAAEHPVAAGEPLQGRRLHGLMSPAGRGHLVCVPDRWHSPAGLRARSHCGINKKTAWSDLHLNPSSYSRRMGLENASRKGRPRNPTECFCREGVMTEVRKENSFLASVRFCLLFAPDPGSLLTIQFVG